MFSPKDTDASDYCQTYFGYSLDGSTPPPYGSGTIKIYDYMQNQYIASYTPGSFMVKVDTCSYFFGGPQMNTDSTDGLYKMVYDMSSGSACPAASTTTCYESYWVTASALGVLAFIDTSSSACPAFFAVADDGSNQDQGTFTIAGVALMRSPSWVPQGYTGSYSAAQGTISITTPGCTVGYKLDQSMAPVTMSFASSGAPAQAGSATLGFIGASSPACPTVCAANGYNVAWDSTGDRLRSECSIVLSFHSLALARRGETPWDVAGGPSERFARMLPSVSHGDFRRCKRPDVGRRPNRPTPDR